jgi:hypothetical protein
MMQLQFTTVECRVGVTLMEAYGRGFELLVSLLDGEYHRDSAARMKL